LPGVTEAAKKPIDQKSVLLSNGTSMPTIRVSMSQRTPRNHRKKKVNTGKMSRRFGSIARNDSMILSGPVP
jgi:hypothetical protein